MRISIKQPCQHAFANCVAINVFGLHGFFDSAGKKRRGPIGGSAKGTPKKASVSPACNTATCGVLNEAFQVAHTPPKHPFYRDLTWYAGNCRLVALFLPATEDSCQKNTAPFMNPFCFASGIISQQATVMADAAIDVHKELYRRFGYDLVPPFARNTRGESCHIISFSQLLSSCM